VPNIESRCNQLKLGHPPGPNASTLGQRKWSRLRVWRALLVAGGSPLFGFYIEKEEKCRAEISRSGRAGPEAPAGRVE
jgi:hypothetical protein